MILKMDRMISLESELRHLPATHRHQLIGLLDVNDNWKTLASSLPNPDRPGELLLKTTDIALLEEQRKRPGCSSSGALLEYWGTYGRRRHTIAEAIHFLEACALNRAADLVRASVSSQQSTKKEEYEGKKNKEEEDSAFFEKKPPPNLNSRSVSWSSDKLPEYSSVADNLIISSSNNDHSSSSLLKPSAPTRSLISFSSEEDTKEDLYLLGNQQTPPLPSSSSDQETTLSPVRFAYRDLQRATENFSPADIGEGGAKVGEGSFGEVFRCATAHLNCPPELARLKYVAVKRFKQLPSLQAAAEQEQEDSKTSQFIAELTTMYRLQHPNLIRLFGYSNDGPSLCIVTEYLENGSLQDFLTKGQQQQQPRSKHPNTVLSFVHRWQIALDDKDSRMVARPYVHRDIKSANIFLDDRLGARLGDLGLVRQGSASNTSTTVVTSTIIGTSVYMAPEAFRGDVSVKIDTFSYGVVLLELLTGLTAFDADRDEADIVSYIDELLGDEFDKLAALEGGGGAGGGCKSSRSYLLDFVNAASSTVDEAVMAQALDTRVTDWNQEAALKLTILAKCCIEQRKKNRPTMNEVELLGGNGSAQADQLRFLNADVCQEVSFEVVATVLFKDKLFLVVQIEEKKEHIVYQIAPSDIHYLDSQPAIYNLHIAEAMTMTERWGFDPARVGNRIATAFGYYSLLQKGEETEEEELIGFIYEKGTSTDQVLRLSTNRLEDVFDLTAGGCAQSGAITSTEEEDQWAGKKCAVVLGTDNEGYFFGFSPMFGSSNGQQLFRVMVAEEDGSFLIKKEVEPGGNDREHPLDWDRFSGFLLDDRLFLFSRQSVFVFTGTQENHEEMVVERGFSYVERSYDDFFRCHPPEGEEYDDDGLFGDFLNYHESTQSPSMNQILFFLLSVVAISFCIRSQIMKRKLAQYKLQRSYYHNRGY
ncbi:Interleukin-1 receptor-associated kinase 4 [Tyrophagus putrescentiae]|nr:Interleukin-1 receptor-associated kinase 4 [Tyrophagus putrescentiae]